MFPNQEIKTPWLKLIINQKKPKQKLVITLDFSETSNFDKK
jgi:hypothetical protein